MDQAEYGRKGTVIIGGRDGNTLLVLGAPVYHGWKDRAQAGMHHRIGDKVVQNCGLSKRAVIALQVVLEGEWQVAGESQEKRIGVAQLACFVFFGYARAL
jgi:hypothetical protein